MPPRWLLVVVTLFAVACQRAAETTLEPDEPVAHSPEPVQQVVITGRVVREGAALAGVRASYGVGEADADVSDEAGEFELALTDDFARAPAIYLTLEPADGGRLQFVLRNPGRSIAATFHADDPQRVELHDPRHEDQAWVDVFAWSMRESDEWQATPKDDYAAHLEQWSRVAEAIAAEPDPYRRGLMTAAQFLIGRGDPEHGLDRSAIALAALDELGLDDPRWSITHSGLAAAVFESGRWAELIPQIDELITHHPQPEVAALIAFERYFATSASGPASEADAVWQRWLARPALARTRIGPTMASLGPKRTLAPGQQLPDLCVEDLAGGQLCLAELHGRMVVLEIWGIGCEGCHKAIADLRAAHAALTGEDAPLFVSISAWNEPEQLAAFMRDEPMPWRHGWVRESERDGFQATLGYRSVPTLILIDAEGVIVASSPELRAELLLERIEALRRGLD
jgi:hypothetical protein